jgi:uncharacterized short protein YbdD (DUF466 family)
VSARLRDVLATLWQRLREWSGDAAYETYVARRGDGPPLGREAFYLDRLRRRYHSGQIDRCC